MAASTPAPGGSTATSGSTSTASAGTATGSPEQLSSLPPENAPPLAPENEPPLAPETGPPLAPENEPPLAPVPSPSSKTGAGTGATPAPPSSAVAAVAPVEGEAVVITPNDEGVYGLNYARGSEEKGVLEVWHTDNLLVDDVTAAHPENADGDKSIYAMSRSVQQIFGEGFLAVDQDGQLTFFDGNPETKFNVTETLVDAKEGIANLRIDLDDDAGVTLRYTPPGGFRWGQGLTGYILEPDSTTSAHANEVESNMKHIAPVAAYERVEPPEFDFNIDLDSDLDGFIESAVAFYGDHMTYLAKGIDGIVARDSANGGQGGAINISFGSSVAGVLRVNQETGFANIFNDRKSALTRQVAKILGKKPKEMAQYGAANDSFNEALAAVAERLQGAVDKSQAVKDARELLGESSKNAAENGLIVLNSAGNENIYATEVLGNAQFGATIEDGTPGWLTVGAAREKPSREVLPFSSQGESLLVTTPAFRTSNAAPEVGGIYLAVQSALLNAGKEQMAVDDFIQLLKNNAVDGPDPANREGFGFIDDDRPFIETLVNQALAGG